MSGKVLAGLMYCLCSSVQDKRASGKPFPHYRFVVNEIILMKGNKIFEGIPKFKYFLLNKSHRFISCVNMK